MLLNLLPGADQQRLLQMLRTFSQEAENLGNQLNGLPPFQVYYKYLDWINTSVRMLRGLVPAGSAAALFQTRRYELLLGINGDHDIARLLMEQELRDRADALTETHSALLAEMRRWSPTSRVIVADTGVYLEHLDRLEDIDFWAQLREHFKPIHLVVPIAVVDELDGQKFKGQGDNRWRASYTLALLHRVIANVPGAVLRESDVNALDEAGRPRSAITLELLLDPPGHMRASITDDEIVARAVDIQTISGQTVTILTYDTGMALRARNANLDYIKLELPSKAEKEARKVQWAAERGEQRPGNLTKSSTA